MKDKNWEKQFDKRWPCPTQMPDGLKDWKPRPIADEQKDFIRQLLQAQKSELKKKVEGKEEVIGKLIAWCSMRIRDHKQMIDAEYLREVLKNLLKERKG